jgi:hypothetical protein
MAASRTMAVTGARTACLVVQSGRCRAGLPTTRWLTPRIRPVSLPSAAARRWTRVVVLGLSGFLTVALRVLVFPTAPVFLSRSAFPARLALPTALMSPAAWSFPRTWQRSTAQVCSAEARHATVCALRLRRLQSLQSLRRRPVPWRRQMFLRARDAPRCQARRRKRSTWRTVSAPQTMAAIIVTIRPSVPTSTAANNALAVPAATTDPLPYIFLGFSSELILRMGAEAVARWPLPGWSPPARWRLDTGARAAAPPGTAEGRRMVLLCLMRKFASRA